ncbi:MAG: histidine triad nucleotide-binding protein [Oceanospirillaceae bacterium]|nr:histidine triad nucleotide-binding protein [Oceanospirillaceae bacterium]
MDNCIFCKIAKGEIPAKTVYEDAHVMAFHDIAPKADTHILVIPKTHITNLMTVGERDWPVLTHLMNKVNHIAAAQGLEGFRLISNNGTKGSQEVMHMHWHVLGGDQLPGF